MKMQFTIGKQDMHGVIDPSLATPSNLHTEFGALVMPSDSRSRPGAAHRSLPDGCRPETAQGRTARFHLDATDGGLEVRQRR